MARELEPIDISHTPELLRLAEDVQRTRRPRLLRRDTEDLVVVSPAPQPRRPRGRVLTEDDPLFGLIGIGDSGIPGGISANKHEALGRLRHT